MNYRPRTPAGAVQVLRGVQRHFNRTPWDERGAAWRYAVALVQQAIMAVRVDLYYWKMGLLGSCRPERPERLEL